MYIVTIRTDNAVRRYGAMTREEARSKWQRIVRDFRLAGVPIVSSGYVPYTRAQI